MSSIVHLVFLLSLSNVFFIVLFQFRTLEWKVVIAIPSEGLRGRAAHCWGWTRCNLLVCTLIRLIATLLLRSAVAWLLCCRMAVRTLGRSLIVCTAAQELNIVSNDFGGVAFCTALVIPFPGLETALNVELSTFLDVLLAKVSKTAPACNCVPFSVFSLLTVAVGVTLCGCYSEACNLSLALEVTYFRVCTNVTDQHYFIKTHIKKNL